MRLSREPRAMARCLTTNASGIRCRELGAAAKIARFRERIAGHERKCHSLSAVALGVDIVRTNALGSGANQQKVMLLEEKLL
jgi:hypothetical protein